MGGMLARIRKGFGKKLIMLHAWNGWIVVILAVSGLVLIGGYWRGVLGEGRVWLKWLHIVVGIVSILPIGYYLFLAGKHWKQIKGKPWQRFNVLVVLALLVGWLVSGVLLWQFRAVGPSVANMSLVVHDLLTWIGLPYIIYHSITRARWLKEPNKRTIVADDTAVNASEYVYTPQPLYTRRGFIRGMIGLGLVVILGPNFWKWMGRSIGSYGGMGSTEQLLENNGNQMIPKPLPLPASALPLGGGARGYFRVYTVTPIPTFSNENWSFTIDGLVNQSFTWDWEQFVALKRTVQVSNFHCVTGWSVYDNTWEGIKLSELLRMAGVQPEARFVKLYSGDGVYTSALSLEQADMDDVMVAVMHDGNEIPSDLGGPVRLIVPQMYAYKSVKWLNRIELITNDHRGYWEVRGYDNDAWI